MIKASGRTGDGKPLVILGLSGENIARLTAIEPIVFNLKELPGLPDIQVLITYRKTEETIIKVLCF